MTAAMMAVSGAALAQSGGGADVCVSIKGETKVDKGESICFSDSTSHAVAVHGGYVDALLDSHATAVGSFAQAVVDSRATAVNGSNATAFVDSEARALNHSSALAFRDSEATAANHSRATALFDSEASALNGGRAFAYDHCTATANSEAETCGEFVPSG
jgi:hypothetical protein